MHFAATASATARLIERLRFKIGNGAHQVIDGEVACPERGQVVSVETCHACPHLTGFGAGTERVWVRCRALPPV